MDGHTPEVAGLDVVEGQWRLAVAQHRELLVDVTGVELTEDPDLQALATIAARLEGYVDTEGQRTERFHRSSQQVTARNEEPTGVRSMLVRLLRRLLPGPFDASTAPDHRSVGTTDTETQYDVNRVYQLSLFFRAMVEDRRDRITTDATEEESTVAAEQSQE